MKIKTRIINTWNWIKEKTKKLKRWLIGGAVVIAATGAVIEMPMPIPMEFQLKVMPSEILTFESKNGITKYYYLGGLITPEPNEIVGQRTKNARYYETGIPHKISLSISVGAPYYKTKTGEWKYLKHATTTDDYFRKQTRLPLFERMLGKRAFADSITENVGASSDDCYARVSDSYFLLDGPNVYVGDYNGTTAWDYRMGMRFTTVSVPAFSTINNGTYLQLHAAGNYETAIPNTFIDGENDDGDPETFSTYTDWNNRVRTTAVVSWTPAAWVDDTAYQSPELKTVIQEIINNGAWVANNDLVLFYRDANGATPSKLVNVASWDHETYAAPILHVEYTEAVAAVGAIPASIIEF